MDDDQINKLMVKAWIKMHEGMHNDDYTPSPNILFEKGFKWTWYLFEQLNKYMAGSIDVLKDCPVPFIHGIEEAIKAIKEMNHSGR